MDKSFNDEELSDIMKEIEALEQDFKADEAVASAPGAHELASINEEVQKAETSVANVVSLETKRPEVKAETSHSTSMSFKIQGDISLDLKFEIGGKTVSLEVTETGLQIEMDGGMKFTVPVSEKSSQKKVA